jgi:hypothetical protein
MNEEVHAAIRGRPNRLSGLAKRLRQLAILAAFALWNGTTKNYRPGCVPRVTARALLKFYFNVVAGEWRGVV